MSYLELKISDLISKDSLEYQSLMDMQKTHSIYTMATLGLRNSQKERLINTIPQDLKIPLDEIEIIHINEAQIIEEGAIFKNAQPILEALDYYNPANTHAQNQYDSLKNTTLFKLQNKKDLKNYLKKIYFSKQNKRLADPNMPKILFFDPCFSNMYHFLFEAYPRLLILLEFFQKQNIQDFYIIAPPKYRHYTKYYDWYIDDIFNMLGIKKEKLIYLEYKIAKTNNVFISTSPRCNPKYVLPAIKKLQTYFYQKDFKNLGNRIYISRKKSAYRYLNNEEEIYHILHKDYGFTRIYMEDYSLKEKINIMMNADIILSVDGTSAINGCFMTKQNAKLIALRVYEMNEFQLFVPSMFDNIQYLPIICDTQEKIGQNIWCESNLYLSPDYLYQKFQEYQIRKIDGRF